VLRGQHDGTAIEKGVGLRLDPFDKITAAGLILAVLLVTGLEARAAAGGGGEETTELNFFPLVGGDTDFGIGVGEVGDWARVNPQTKQFSRRLENAVFVTFKLRDGKLIVPYVDVYLLLTVTRFGPEDRFRLEIRPSYTDERTLGYYGMGNASQVPAGFSDPQLQYRRIHPGLSTKLRFNLGGGFFLTQMSQFTYSDLLVGEDSFLAYQKANGPSKVKELIGGFDPHLLLISGLGVEYDTRDNETVTRRGQWHAIYVRGTPALGAWAPYAYLQLNATARFYSQPIPRWLKLSARLVADTIVGDPPFYELARFEDTAAIGGGKAMRGVPAQRYHGKVKLFGNFEARSDLFHFTVRKKPLVLGAAAFVDIGRSWTELFQRLPELDGTGWGLKYSVGGGLRLQEGTTFVLRADIAWSPDARPIGGYFAAGEIF